MSPKETMTNEPTKAHREMAAKALGHSAPYPGWLETGECPYGGELTYFNLNTAAGAFADFESSLSESRGSPLPQIGEPRFNPLIGDVTPDYVGMYLLELAATCVRALEDPDMHSAAKEQAVLALAKGLRGLTPSPESPGELRASERQGGEGREVMILEAAYAPTPEGPWETRTFTAVTSAADGSPDPSEWCPASESGFILKPEQKFWRWRVVRYAPVAVERQGGDESDDGLPECLFPECGRVAAHCAEHVADQTCEAWARGWHAGSGGESLSDNPYGTCTARALHAATERHDGDGREVWVVESPDGKLVDAWFDKEAGKGYRNVRYTPSQPAPSADAAMARWAVECLDAWADAVRDEQRGNFTYQVDGKHFCAVKSGGYGHCGQYRGVSPDAARISAAKALFAADPSLPAPPGGGK